MRIMPQAAIVSFVLVAALVGLPGFPRPAGAVEPERFEIPIDRTAPAPLISAQCGFPVSRHDVGTVTIVLFFNQDGSVRAEIDSWRHVTITFFSPATGKSFTYRESEQLITFYSGNELGDDVRAFFAGLFRHARGATTAGNTTLDAVLVGFGPLGVPLIEGVGPPTVHGVTHTGAEFRQSICDILAP